MDLPFYTADLPGIGGRLKAHLEDFFVEELPRYAPSGQGSHCYISVEKRGISTLQAVNLLARALGRRAIDIGYAGLKDTRAVARQTFSVEGETEARLRALELPHMRILQVARHQNKLQIGHLAGNRFTIKIRHPDWDKPGGAVSGAEAQTRAVLDRLERSGVPNFFGPQRFGQRGNNHELGRVLLREAPEEFLKRWLGAPDPRLDHGGVLEARQHFEQGRFDLALAAWPGHMHTERRALAVLARAPKAYARAAATLDQSLRRLLISALQAHLFNETLRLRLSRLDRILPGDLAWKHDRGAVFRVPLTAPEVAVEQARADRHEISPSGPMFGYRMTNPTGEPAQMEEQVLRAHGLTPENFHGGRSLATPAAAGETEAGAGAARCSAPGPEPVAFAKHAGGRRGPVEKSKGSRRAMRFFPAELDLGAGTDAYGSFLQLRFVLAAGCFATVLLGEIMKTPGQGMAGLKP